MCQLDGVEDRVEQMRRHGALVVRDLHVDLRRRDEDLAIVRVELDWRLVDVLVRHLVVRSDLCFRACVIGVAARREIFVAGDLLHEHGVVVAERHQRQAVGEVQSLVVFRVGRQWIEVETSRANPIRSVDVLC